MTSPFELPSDEDETKNMYGRKVRGIERSTFLVNEEGWWRANGAG